MTDLLRLATELERSGGMHRFIALVQAASLVLLRFEHGESGGGMSDKAIKAALQSTRECEPGVPHQWHDTVDGEMCAACCATRRTVTVRGERWPLPVTDCQDEPRITHAPDSPIPDLVREPGRKLVPRPWQRPVDPTIAAEDPA